MRNLYLVVVDGPGTPADIDRELHTVLDALLDTDAFMTSHLGALDVIRPKESEELVEHMRTYYEKIEEDLH